MRVLTISRHFPTNHRRAAQPTFFVEKIMACLADQVPGWKMKNDFVMYDWHEYFNCTMPKGHTIRAGARWKAGDTASLRVWSGKPYRSKQVEFAQVEVKKMYPFIIHQVGGETLWQIPGVGCGNFDSTCSGLQLIARNDGLECDDFVNWFKIHPKNKDGFTGQVISWSEKIEYT